MLIAAFRMSFCEASSFHRLHHREHAARRTPVSHYMRTGEARQRAVCVLQVAEPEHPRPNLLHERQEDHDHGPAAQNGRQQATVDPPEGAHGAA